jgi:hypothetical protein
VKKKELFTLCVVGLALLGSFASAYAQDSNNNTPDYKLLTTISNIPGNLAGVFDISWVDSETGRYYLTTRGVPTATPPVGPSVTVIDTENDTYLFSIPLSTPGNGVVAIHRVGDDDQGNGSGILVVGGSDSTAIFIPALPFATPIAVVPTNRKSPPQGAVNGRADELAYDPADHIILIANDRATPDPFVSFISVGSNPQKVGEIVYDGSTPLNPKSTGGIEQPVWDQVTRRFYIAIPSTAAHDNGEVDEINPMTMKITRIFPTSCGPAGLALIPGQRLMTSCGDVLDIATGAVVTTVPPGVLVDEIWFNPGDDRVYFGALFSSPVLSGVPPYRVIDTLPWKGFFTPPPFQFSHSIAADSQNNHVYVPVTNRGVLVFTDDNGQGPNN